MCTCTGTQLKVKTDSYRREFSGFRCRAREPRKLEVGEFQDKIVTVDEHVGWLESAVDDARAVREPQSSQQLVGEDAAVRHGHLTGRYQTP